MKFIEHIEVKLYLRWPWAEALAGFAGKALEGDSLPSDLKGALIEFLEAVSEAKQTANQ